jgi:class I fructose-bisphosphate aldolase
VDIQSVLGVEAESLLTHESKGILREDLTQPGPDDVGQTSQLVYDTLTTDQVASCSMGRMGLINSGGASSGVSDQAEAVRTAVINKRAGGMGLISGRKAFQRPMSEGIELLNAIQDVYADSSITIA